MVATVFPFTCILSFDVSNRKSVSSANVVVGTARPATTTNALRSSRRSWLKTVSSTMLIIGFGERVLAEDGSGYNNPNTPAGPEERSGLVVLRVAEVAAFQEKILRAIVNGDIDVVVSPMQIVFGTQILLRNSNLAGNMKLMIDTEIPRKKRPEAVQNAIKTMNTIQSISTTAANIQRPFADSEMLEIADLYRDVRLQLDSMYQYLPQKEKNKYYGYFMAVTEYEKKIAEGVYNPDIDGVLQLKYDN